MNLWTLMFNLALALGCLLKSCDCLSSLFYSWWVLVNECVPILVSVAKGGISKNFLHMCRQGRLPWPQEWAPTCLLALAGLFLPLALSLEYRGENKGSILLHLTTPGIWPRGPLSPISRIYPDVNCSGWEATPMTLSYALSLVSPFLLQPYGSHFLRSLLQPSMGYAYPIVLPETLRKI